MTDYISDARMAELAELAADTYEFTGDWSCAFRAVTEHARDEWRCSLRRSAVLLALKLARTRWLVRVQQARAAVSA